jgi:hypothetical protein
MATEFNWKEKPDLLDQSYKEIQKWAEKTVEFLDESEKKILTEVVKACLGKDYNFTQLDCHRVRKQEIAGRYNYRLFFDNIEVGHTELMLDSNSIPIGIKFLPKT